MSWNWIKRFNLKQLLLLFYGLALVVVLGLTLVSSLPIFNHFAKERLSDSHRAEAYFMAQTMKGRLLANVSQMEDLASLPFLINATMRTGVLAKDVTDWIQDVKVGGQKLPLGIFDFDLSPVGQRGQPAPPEALEKVRRDVLEGDQPFSIYLHAKGLVLMVGVYYENLVEGLFVLELGSQT